LYLSDRDLAWAIAKGDLLVKDKPSSPPPKIDPTSIDLHLDAVEQAKIWDVSKFETDCRTSGVGAPELHIGKFQYVDYAERYLRDLPETDAIVFRRGGQVIVKPGGFLLWQTREVVGTPDERADLICFVNGKSTRARTGILVHFTAPTIHAAWSGNIILEIANLGPFHFVLEAGDVIAQLTVARITSSPEKSQIQAGTSTLGQTGPAGRKSSAS
jgi:deoxycytidine triphosphate deaminase